MILHRSLRSTVGGLLAVALLASAPLASAQATTQVSPLPPINPSVAPYGGQAWAAPIGADANNYPRPAAPNEYARTANMCASVTAQPGLYQRSLVAECQGGAFVE